MKICYVPKKFNARHEAVIATANKIIEEYQAQGYDLTLRQVYYQFVARDLIPNKQNEYDNLGVIINDARLAGRISWRAIVDRTRNVEANSHWSTPAEIVRGCADQYQIDKWANQTTRVEVWIEKDALKGVVEGVCSRLDVSYFSCRGYTSSSEMWAAAMRLAKYEKTGQRVKIIHLGDHDPSGIDMTRDIEDRLQLFRSKPIEVKRIALNMNQVKRYKCPPNPAKLSDGRAAKYIEQYGPDSWELDALEPKVIENLIEAAIREEREEDFWQESVEKEEAHKETLSKAAKRMEKA